MGVRKKIIAHCDRCGVEREFDSPFDLIKTRWEVYVHDGTTICPHCRALFINGFFTEDELRKLDYETKSGKL